ncbi:MAG: hypothetical protein ACJAYE_001758 [Candidatus Azotimanducaceae bacterium]|jgi:hypothetical protein
MTTPNRSADDKEIEQAFTEVISKVNQTRHEESVPPKLDRKIKRLAHSSATDELEKSWIMGNAARLSLVVLLFFSIAMVWLSL